MVYYGSPLAPVKNKFRNLDRELSAVFLGILDPDGVKCKEDASEKVFVYITVIRTMIRRQL